MRAYHLVVAALAVAAAPAGLLPMPLAVAAGSMTPISAAPKSWTVGGLVLSAGYARATLPRAPVGGGFITIANTGEADDTLVSASSPAAGAVQLHSMTLSGGIMEMRDLPNGVPIPAGETVAFSPSGLHLMFVHPKSAFVEGRTVPVTLNFAKAGSVTIELAVGGIAANSPPGDASGAGADDSMPAMKM